MEPLLSVGIFVLMLVGVSFIDDDIKYLGWVFLPILYPIYLAILLCETLRKVL